MKKLILLRHAKSSWEDSELDDFDRPLNKRGKKNLKMMAKRLAHYNPELIIASPALRTKKTAKGVAKAHTPILFEKRLYDAGVQTYISIINAIPQKFNEVIIVGHNPELTQTANFLSNAHIDNIPTCGYVVLECEEFCEVGEGSMSMVLFDYPKLDRI